MTERDIERWTREVAEDPGAPSFVKLARAYRSQGRRDAARDVVLQGLDHNPEHIGGHGLLAIIHVEDGERQKAGDEWHTVLRLEPGNFEASRGLGFLALERGDLQEARRHLETAHDARPEDPAVTQALDVLARREEADRPQEGPSTADRRAAEAEGEVETPADAGGAAGEAAVPEAKPTAKARESAGAPPSAVGQRRSAVRDPSRLFDVLSNEAPFLGALVLDAQGLVVAGSIELEGTQGDLLGALINTAVEEARRTTGLIQLGGWEGMLLDCDAATLHVAGLDDGAVVLMAVRSGAPAGWTVRTAERAGSLARTFLEDQA